MKLLDIPESVFKFDQEYDDPKEMLVLGLTRILNLITNEPALGNRHTQLWSTTKNLLKVGLAPSSVADIIFNINSHWSNPKTTEEIELIIEQACQ